VHYRVKLKDKQIYIELVMNLLPTNGSCEWFTVFDYRLSIVSINLNWHFNERKAIHPQTNLKQNIIGGKNGGQKTTKIK
jgi:hypothetical protein